VRRVLRVRGLSIVRRDREASVPRVRWRRRRADPLVRLRPLSDGEQHSSVGRYSPVRDSLGGASRM
jgi:hypothetical protein